MEPAAQWVAHYSDPHLSLASSQGLCCTATCYQVVSYHDCCLGKAILVQRGLSSRLALALLSPFKAEEVCDTDLVKYQGSHKRSAGDKLM